VDGPRRPPATPLPAAEEALFVGETLNEGLVVDYPLGVVSAAMFVGTAALMILGVQPVVLSALAEAGWITQQQAGPLGTAEVLAIALGSALGPTLLRSGGVRWKTAALSLALGACNLGVLKVHGYLGLSLLRGAAGLAEGLALGAVILLTLRNSQPDRLNAIFLAVQTAPQAVLAYFLPTVITPRFGPEAGFIILALLAVASAAASLLLADEIPMPRDETRRRGRWPLSVFVALGAVGLQNAAIGGAWDYIDLLAVQYHLPASLAGVAVSGGLVLQVIGAFLVALWGPRIPFLAALIVGSLCQAGIIAVLSRADNALLYLAPALAFGLFWLAMNPFQVRLLIDLDPERQAAVYLTAVVLVGMSIGPTVCALGVKGTDVTGAFQIAAALMGLGSAAYVWLAVARPARSSTAP
jgi:MFS transporter, DHA1 family, inner membrane transport protein